MRALRLHFDSVDKFKTPDQLQEYVLDLCMNLGETDEDWKPRLSALEMIEKLAIQSMEPENKDFYLMMNQRFMKKAIVIRLSEVLNIQISDERSEITKQCSRAVVALAKCLDKRMKRIAIRLFPEFLKGVGRAHKVIRSHVDMATVAMIEHVQTQEFIQTILEVHKTTKNLNIQEACGRYIHQIMSTWTLETMKDKLEEEEIDELDTLLKKLVDGKTPEIRELARKTYWYYAHYFPDRKDSFERKLSKRASVMLLETEIDLSNHRSSLSASPSMSRSASDSCIDTKVRKESRKKSNRLSPKKKLKRNKRKSAKIKVIEITPPEEPEAPEEIDEIEEIQEEPVKIIKTLDRSRSMDELSLTSSGSTMTKPNSEEHSELKTNLGKLESLVGKQEISIAEQQVEISKLKLTVAEQQRAQAKQLEEFQKMRQEWEQYRLQNAAAQQLSIQQDQTDEST